MQSQSQTQPAANRIMSRRQLLLSAASLTFGIAASALPAQQERRTAAGQMNKYFLAASGTVRDGSGSDPTPGWRTYADRLGITIGSLGNSAHFAMPDYVSIIRNDFNLFVPDWEFCWRAVRPQPDVANYSIADAMLRSLDRLVGRPLRIRAGFLAWSHNNPAWLNVSVTH